MRFIDYIYFNIYRWYYNMKMDGRKVDPTGMTAIMFGVCFGGWFVLLDWLYYHFMLHTYPGSINKLVSIFVVFLFAGLINQIYLSNDKYLKVYNDYISSATEKNRGKSTFFSFIFIILPFLLLGVIGLLLALK